MMTIHTGEFFSAALAALVIFPAVSALADTKKGGNPLVVLSTAMGDITIELDPGKAPETVKNFLEYVEAGHYDGTIFHRVIPNFMIQGGGFGPDMKEKSTRKPIKNEAANGMKNELGTIAMARTNVVDSATSQFFINTKNNEFLNHKGPANFGYAVFGKVISGLDVVQNIEKVKTASRAGHSDVPMEPVAIKTARVKK